MEKPKKKYIAGDSPIEIEGFNTKGEGVAQIDGEWVNFPMTVPGDIIQPLKLGRKSYKLISPSAYRTNDLVCPALGSCGSCKLQHVDYSRQLEYKKYLVEQALDANKINTRVLPVIGMENPYRYRNKMVFSFQFEEGRMMSGFYEEESHRLVPVSDCLIHHAIAETILKAFETYLNESRVSIFDRETNRGLVRNLVIRRSDATGKIMVIVVINANKPAMPAREKLVNLITSSSSDIDSIYINLNPQGTGIVLGEDNVNVFGQKNIADYIGEMKYEISPGTFFQTNGIQTRVLYQKVLDFCQLQGNETVYDLYSGVGTISLMLATKSKEVYGIESVKQSVENARKNAAINKIKNVEFVYGKSEYNLPRLARRTDTPDVIVLDPPRSGCAAPLLSALLKIKPSRIVYVSCNPDTLARDLKVLSQMYFIKEIQPVDMFPHTLHVECVAGLVLKKQ